MAKEPFTQNYRRTTTALRKRTANDRRPQLTSTRDLYHKRGASPLKDKKLGTMVPVISEMPIFPLTPLRPRRRKLVQLIQHLTDYLIPLLRPTLLRLGYLFIVWSVFTIFSLGVPSGRTSSYSSRQSAFLRQEWSLVLKQFVMYDRHGDYK